MFEKFFDIFDYVVTPSKFMHEHLSSTYKSLRGRLRCIPNGSYTSNEIKKFTSVKRQSNLIPKIGFFGQLLADKGVYELLLAFEQLLLAGIKFEADFWGGNLLLNPMVFQNKFNEKYQSLEGNKVGSEINLKGEYKNIEAIDLMKSYSILIFPSKWPETFSLVMSEALLSGRTLIVPNIGAYKERAKLYKDRVLTYDIKSSTGIYDTIRIALNKKIPASNYEIAEDLSVESMAENYISLVALKK
jgi:glycosyltransferase involved in cell wall biosynthesis